MKQISILLLIILQFSSCQSSMVDPNLKLLKEQITAFNNKDLETMLTNISDDFKWYGLSSDSLMIEASGKEEFEKSMKQYFKAISEINSKLADYIIIGNKISFIETVTYKNSKGEVFIW